MKKADLIRMVEEILTPFAEEKKYEIVDVDFVKEGANWYLRVLADKEGGFSINDCVDTSHYLDDKLENADPIETPYILEVSSPGIDRPLKKDKDFVRGMGKSMEVKLFKAREQGIFAGAKEFTATLTGFSPEDNTVTLENEKGEAETVARTEIALIRPEVIF